MNVQGVKLDGIQPRRCAPVVVATLAIVAACSGETDTRTTAGAGTENAADAAPAPERPAPRFPDGRIRFDRIAGEKGYWGPSSVSSLFEATADVSFDAQGLLTDIDDAPKVAPFMPWSLALYRHRQQNGLADDPVRYCISPAGPRHLHTPPGFRIIQDRNFNRVYILFGGGNRNWRVIYLDGREPPNPDEVVGTYFGYSTGRWEGDTLIVESTGFNDRFWFSNGGLPHTAGLRLTEHFSRPSHDTLLYEVTIDDPLTYTRPWTARASMQWVDGGEMAEQFCED